MAGPKKKSAATKRVHSSASSGRTGLAGGRSGSAGVVADDSLSALRVRYLLAEFGDTHLASIVGVHRLQLLRWAAGEQRPGPGAAPLLIDLEHVLARARLVWGGAAARTWLESANVYLGGARPIDVIRVSGPALVLEALNGEMWGGAA
ncbi:antitoxin Xre/MbcA/ParS toxin-binding domain-containing protein [Rhodococcus sp. ARC_M6]|uniref:antitoxin Xre/MbcA/ParS toxin-binding domain-containing protein n=1 Tax=Rhodococcus sp. ARC_M6 TaxID=2928852 RepID=UPI001FB247E8|nr:antitoxin Xre/MbcA/ParS toxin-binding domain-containing protein [Rhodococcus sp. ARC_M6]MCJ0907059.1 DUF2384 domain-containing protein [Rhodococcus sp. ARC_M6]